MKVPTLFTCGMWLPVWILVAIFGSSSRSALALAVAGPGRHRAAQPEAVDHRRGGPRLDRARRERAAPVGVAVLVLVGGSAG